MTQRTQTDFMALTIGAGEGRDESSSPAGPNYSYLVTVKSDATGARIRFTYHGSINDRSRGIDALDREGLLYAFWSFVSDAQAGESSFPDFAADFGYDEDSYTARRIHKACKAALVKFNRLYHDGARFTPEYVLERLADEGIE